MTTNLPRRAPRVGFARRPGLRVSLSLHLFLFETFARRNRIIETPRSSAQRASSFLLLVLSSPALDVSDHNSYSVCLRSAQQIALNGKCKQKRKARVAALNLSANIASRPRNALQIAFSFPSPSPPRQCRLAVSIPTRILHHSRLLQPPPRHCRQWATRRIIITANQKAARSENARAFANIC